MNDVTFIVSDMTGSRCEATVRSALMQVAGVAAVAIDLSKKSVSVRFDSNCTSVQALSDAIGDAGYEAAPV